MSQKKGQSIVIALLLTVAVCLLFFAYTLPVWWVSLTAPNYPPEAFPDGVRIHFHLNGVFNGCEMVVKDEVQVDEALDCVHEMDTINHYVGMYPIASGGVIEITFSLFILAMLGVMVLGFACTNPKGRMAFLAIGFAAVTVWMGLSWYGGDGLQYHNSRYIARLVSQLDQDTEAESEQLSSGDAVIERLKASLEASGVSTEDTTENKAAEEAPKTPKQQNMETLRKIYVADQEKLPEAEREAWNGSGSQVMSWYYATSLDKYFNNPEEIKPMVSKMTLAAHIVFWAVIFFMVILIFGSRKNSGILYWALILLPMLLPVLFVLLYAGWLGWYGHNLNDMGAFTLKPFMPTVFGQGKVAQFTTSSYPHIGFAFMAAFTVLLAVAGLTRRGQLHDKGA